MQVTNRSEIDLIKELEEKGYDHNIIFKNDKIYLDEVKEEKAYTKDDICIDHTFRFEGKSNPDDMSIMYALRTSDGQKGVIVIAYGPTGNLEAAEFFKEVEDHQVIAE